jgi:hypothetical protein
MTRDGLKDAIFWQEDRTQAAAEFATSNSVKGKYERFASGSGEHPPPDRPHTEQLFIRLRRLADLWNWGFPGFDELFIELIFAFPGYRRTHKKIVEQSFENIEVPLSFPGFDFSSMSEGALPLFMNSSISL